MNSPLLQAGRAAITGIINAVSPSRSASPNLAVTQELNITFIPTEEIYDMATLEELLAQKAKIEEQIQIAKLESAVECWKKIDWELRVAGLTVQDLINHYAPSGSLKKTATDKRTEAAPKYQDPNNPQNTWTGRGRPAAWLQSYIDKGHSKEEFLIK